MREYRLSTWKGRRSAWRTVRAFMVFHLQSALLLIRLLFWIADRRSGTSSGHEFCFTNSAATMTRNCQHTYLELTHKRKVLNGKFGWQNRNNRHTTSTRTFRTAGSTWSKARMSWSLNSLLTFDNIVSSSLILRLVKFLR